MEPTLSTKTLGDVFSDRWRIYLGGFWKIVRISAIVLLGAFLVVVIPGTLLVFLWAGLAASVPTTSFGPPSIANFAPHVGIFVILIALMVVGSPLLVLFEGAIAHVICQRHVRQPVSVGHALRRRPHLVRANWRRLLGYSIIASLVFSAVVVSLNIIKVIISFNGTLVAYIFVLPAFTIAKTVLYCDLRARAEGPEQFNEDALARDLGLVPVEKKEGWSRFNPA